MSDAESDAAPESGARAVRAWRTPLRVIPQPSEAAWRAPGGGQDLGVAWFGLAMWGAYLALLPVGRAFDPVLWVMGFVWLCWRAPQPIRVAVTPQVLWVERWYTAFFLALWLPMVVSAAFSTFAAPAPAQGPVYDASHEALLASVLHLRFWLAGLLLIVVLQEPLMRQMAGMLALLAASIWSVDALIQGWAGRGLGGPPVEQGMPNGVFRSVGDLGNALALVAPIGVGWALLKPPVSSPPPERNTLSLTWGLRIWALLIWLISISAVIHASRRGALVMMAVWSLGLLFVLVFRARLAWRTATRTRCWACLVAMVATLAMVVGAGMVWLNQSHVFQDRVAQTRQLFAGDLDAIDAALTGRISMWRTASHMVEAHPWLGVGPGNFRLAYPVYAEEGDRWVQSQRKRQWSTMTRDERRQIRAEYGGRDFYPPTFGAMHAHQLLIEAFAETGVVGLLGWSVGVGVLVFFTLWATRRRCARGDGYPSLAFGAVLAVFAIAFPLNTHPSLHGAFFGSLCWFNLALAMALVVGWPSPREQPQRNKLAAS